MPFPTSIDTKPVQPCKRGHVAGRDANGTCKDCRRAAARQRYHTNPATAAKVKAGANAWRKANPQKIKAKGCAYRLNNPTQTLLESARDRARKGGYVCTLTVRDIIIPEFCPLLGIRLQRGSGSGGAKASSPSLDKIEPHLGYVRGNVWVISHRANMIKNDATLDELQLLVSKLSERLGQ